MGEMQFVVESIIRNQPRPRQLGQSQVLKHPRKISAGFGAKGKTGKTKFTFQKAIAANHS